MNVELRSTARVVAIQGSEKSLGGYNRRVVNTKGMIIGALTPFLLVYPLFAVQTGTVTGVVRDAAGMPKAGVRIAAKPADPSEGDVLVGIDQTGKDARQQIKLAPSLLTRWLFFRFSLIALSP